MVEKYDITVTGGLKGATPKKVQKGKRQASLSWFYLGLVGQIGYTVAIPLVAGALLGTLADREIGIKPYGTLIGLGLGFIVSVVGFVRTIRDALARKM